MSFSSHSFYNLLCLSNSLVIHASPGIMFARLEYNALESIEENLPNCVHCITLCYTLPNLTKRENIQLGDLWEFLMQVKFINWGALIKDTWRCCRVMMLPTQPKTGASQSCMLKQSVKVVNPRQHIQFLDIRVPIPALKKSLTIWRYVFFVRLEYFAFCGLCFTKPKHWMSIW